MHWNSARTVEMYDDHRSNISVVILACSGFFYHPHWPSTLQLPSWPSETPYLSGHTPSGPVEGIRHWEQWFPLHQWHQPSVMLQAVCPVLGITLCRNKMIKYAFYSKHADIFALLHVCKFVCIMSALSGRLSESPSPDLHLSATEAATAPQLAY